MPTDRQNLKVLTNVNRYKMKKGLLLIVAIFSLLTCYAQKIDVPGWIFSTPKAKNGTYQYVVESAIGTTEAEARNRAIAQVFLSAMMRIGMPVSSGEINQALQEGKTYGEISMQYNIPINKVCEYSEIVSNGYKVYVLCQVAIPRVSPNFEEFTGCSDTRKYRNWVAGVESALLPGLGQMTKHRGGAGTGFLVGELVLVGGAIGIYFSAKNTSSWGKPHSVKERGYSSNYNFFINRYNTLRIINHSLFYSAAALHLINIVHAVCVKPKYKTKKVKSNNLSMYPALIPNSRNDMALGLGVTLKF